MRITHRDALRDRIVLELEGGLVDGEVRQVREAVRHLVGGGFRKITINLENAHPVGDKAWKDLEHLIREARRENVRIRLRTRPGIPGIQHAS